MSSKAGMSNFFHQLANFSFDIMAVARISLKSQLLYKNMWHCSSICLLFQMLVAIAAQQRPALKVNTIDLRAN